MKPPIRDQLLKAGFKGTEPEEKPREEFIQGEISHTRNSGINEISRSLYGKPAVFRFQKHRHGRAVVMNIKEEMEKSRRSRDRTPFKLAMCFVTNRNTWLSSKEIETATGISARAFSGTVSQFFTTKLLVREGRVGTKGYVYRLNPLAPPAATAEEIYLKFLELVKPVKKKVKKANELTREQLRGRHPSARPILDALTAEIEKVLGVKVEVSGNIDITFKLG